MNRPKIPPRWERIHKIPNGHKIFRNDRHRGDPQSMLYAVADDSGSFPELTDDGVLLLDRTRPIQVGWAKDPNGHYSLRINLPLTDFDGQTSYTPSNVEGAAWLRTNLGMQIELSPSARKYCEQVAALL